MWRAWARSPIAQLCDEELAVIVEHHRYWAEPASRRHSRRIRRQPRSGGNRRDSPLLATWNSGTGSGNPFSRCSPRSMKRRPAPVCGRDGFARVGRDDDLAAVAGGAHP